MLDFTAGRKRSGIGQVTIRKSATGSVRSDKFAKRWSVFFQQVLWAAVVIVDGRQLWIDTQVVVQRRVNLGIGHRTLTRKQRRTATRIFERLQNEHDYEGGEIDRQNGHLLFRSICPAIRRRTSSSAALPYFLMK
jgi:hypothetical protein